MFDGVCRRELYGDISMCRFPIDSYVNAVGVSVNGKILQPLEHKLAAFNFYINRMLTPPTTKQAKQQECKIILAIAQNSGFPKHIIQELKKKLTTKKKKPKSPNNNNTTNQKMGNILISQSTNKKNN